MDRGSILRVWLPLVLGLYAVYFVFVHGPGPCDAVRWVGLVVCVVGLGGVILGRYTLGRSFSIAPKATALVTNGIYSRIRNPIYVSSVTFILGLVVMMRRALWLALLLIIIIPMQIIRARQEARVLEEKFGDAYREYRKRTWL
jgi:protein-S-isoprenylcysteine O-methyltransferase Ste14